MFLTEFRRQKYTGGIFSWVGIFLTVTPEAKLAMLVCIIASPSQTQMLDVLSTIEIGFANANARYAVALRQGNTLFF